jgi:hypothetical protein
MTANARYPALERERERESRKIKQFVDSAVGGTLWVHHNIMIKGLRKFQTWLKAGEALVIVVAMPEQ